jgi:integrase
MNCGVVNDIVVEAAEDAGIQEVLYTDAGEIAHNKFTSHALRHSFAMHWLGTYRTRLPAYASTYHGNEKGGFDPPKAFADFDETCQE